VLIRPQPVGNSLFVKSLSGVLTSLANSLANFSSSNV
jgi:hypothetical protein